MKKMLPAAVTAVLLAAALTGCASTYPAQLNLDPTRYENDAVRVEWAIGINFFELKLTNLTSEQIDLDLESCAIVSVDGEARPLARIVNTDAPFIPPKSYVVLSGNRGAIFGTDIYGKFNNESNEKYPVSFDASNNDRMYLKGHSGETLRLYLAGTVKGKKTVLDIPFRILGASRVQQGAEDTQQQTSQQPAAKPKT
jgi:hypothetical protein